MGETRIREALELLDGGRRWVKYAPGEDDEGRVCMMVALSRMAGVGSNHFLRDRDALKAVVLEHFGWHCLSAWNDHPDTTWADIELVMEKAALMREEAVE